MKRSFLHACLFFSIATLSAQDIMQELGGIATNFAIQIDDQPLEVVDQFVTKRTRCIGETGCGEFYYFEFTLNEIRLLDELKTVSRGRYRVAFLAQDGATLAVRRTGISGGGPDRSNPKSDAPLGVSCYKIRLSGIPLTVLRHCRTIVFVARP